MGFCHAVARQALKVRVPYSAITRNTHACLRVVVLLLDVQLQTRSETAAQTSSLLVLANGVLA